eukprot:CAMPEP_0119533068 /NCGR_PEP_ID=MMETSP1344-20130328/46510_1 /TAXON_ID=236787 /ORGANISM="Florenciella parvula, Strain CCMP2471" /LENGTH=56 /DNA_ID=CAMNT_0007573813 /DNA_START=90 /DNA_END=257 /DNA_ORIENTATION=+
MTTQDPCPASTTRTTYDPSGTSAKPATLLHTLPSLPVTHDGQPPDQPVQDRPRLGL